MDIWDGVQVGLQAATLAKASQAQRTLASMHATAANEAARREMIEEMKNSIFNLSHGIQKAEEQLVDHPIQRYLVLSFFECELKESALSASGFPDIQDKEYFVNTQKKLANAIEKSHDCLTPEQYEQAITAFQYAWEMPLLRAVIQAKSAQESLNETDEQWRKLSARQSQKGLFKGLGIAGIICTFLVGCPMSCFGLVGLGASQKPGGATVASLVMLAIASCIPIGTIALFVLSAKSNAGYSKLKASRDQWQSLLLSKDDAKRAVDLFGDLPSDQYRDLSSKRQAFLAPIIGANEFSQFMLSDPRQ
jgi:hypothetical protein